MPLMPYVLLLQVDGIIAQAEIMPAITPPAGSNWWQGLLWLAMLTLSGIITKGISMHMERRSALDAAGGGLRRQLRELSASHKEGLLTDEEFAGQKKILLQPKQPIHA